MNGKAWACRIYLRTRRRVCSEEVYVFTACGSAVCFVAVAYCDHINAQHIIVDATNNTLITDAVFPNFAELGAFQRLANAARIIQRRYTSMQKRKDALQLVGQINLNRALLRGQAQFAKP